MVFQPHVIKFDITPCDGFYKAVTNDHIDLTVMGETVQEIREMLPEAIKAAMERKYKSKLADQISVDKAMQANSTYVVSASSQFSIVG